MKTVKSFLFVLFYKILEFIVEELALAIDINRPSSTKALGRLVRLSPNITCDLLVPNIA